MTIYYKLQKLLRKPKMKSVVSVCKTGIKIAKKAMKFMVALTTFAASIATCITVIQMRNERNQSYKPYFVMETVSYTDEFTEPRFDIRDSENLRDSLMVDDGERPQMDIVIRNIGSGTAVNVDITFSDEAYEKLWEIACTYYDDEKIEITESELRSYDNMSQKMQHVCDINRRDLTRYEAYIVPGAVTELPLPEELRTLLRSIAYCTNGDCEELPEIELNVNYKDLQGICYEETYKFRIRLSVDLHSKDSKYIANYVIEQCKR